nr:hypothetical protein [uncultured Oscillibacter sp.]
MNRQDEGIKHFWCSPIINKIYQKRRDTFMWRKNDLGSELILEGRAYPVRESGVLFYHINSGRHWLLEDETKTNKPYLLLFDKEGLMLRFSFFEDETEYPSSEPSSLFAYFILGGDDSDFVVSISAYPYNGKNDGDIIYGSDPRMVAHVRKTFCFMKEGTYYGA